MVTQTHTVNDSKPILCVNVYITINTMLTQMLTQTQALCVNRVIRPVHTERQRYRQRIKRYVDGQMDLQPTVPVTVPVKKIKGTACQRYVVTPGINVWRDGVARCEQGFNRPSDVGSSPRVWTLTRLRDIYLKF